MSQKTSQRAFKALMTTSMSLGSEQKSIRSLSFLYFSSGEAISSADVALMNESFYAMFISFSNSIDIISLLASVSFFSANRKCFWAGSRAF
jgi:hypothetical protein